MHGENLRVLGSQADNSSPHWTIERIPHQAMQSGSRGGFRLRLTYLLLTRSSMDHRRREKYAHCNGADGVEIEADHKASVWKDDQTP